MHAVALRKSRSLLRRLGGHVGRRPGGGPAPRQAWKAQPSLIYSDAADVDPLTGEERAEFLDVLTGRPHVEFDHDDGRPLPSATVLIRVEDRGARPMDGDDVPRWLGDQRPSWSLMLEV